LLLRRQNCFKFRGKPERFTLGGVKEGFLADPVAGQHQPLCSGVPQGKGKHAVERLQAMLAHFFVEVDDNFGIAPALEAVTSLLQTFSQGAIIVDFAVADDPDGAVFVADGLPAAVQVNDAQATAAEADTAAQIRALVVRATMRQAVHHGLQIRQGDTRWADFTANAAHLS
jgi:hypothetical protein